MYLFTAIRNLFKKKVSKPIIKEKISMSPISREARRREIDKIIEHNEAVRKRYTPKKDTGARRRAKDIVASKKDDDMDIVDVAIGIAALATSYSDSAEADNSNSVNSGGGDFGGGGASSDY